MKIFNKVKTKADLSDFVTTSKDSCYQTHKGKSQVKINHVLKAGNSFSHGNNVLKMASFQNYFKRACFPYVIHL